METPHRYKKKIEEFREVKRKRLAKIATKKK